jgi:uncharacterized membrane protein YcaP (DUF421 family)
LAEAGGVGRLRGASSDSEPERARKAGFLEDDILEQARANQGIEGMEQIKYAVLERDGSISIIPKSG